MAPFKHPLALLLLASALTSCQFSFSAGGPDYNKLESAITSELNESYKALDHQVDKVDCPRQRPAPKPGDTFVCKADLNGNAVRVKVTATDDQHVNFSTMDNVYDLSSTAQGLTKDISADRGFAITVTCGEGLKVVEIGESFTCTATDRRGDSRTVKVIAGTPDRWELLREP